VCVSLSLLSVTQLFHNQFEEKNNILKEFLSLLKNVLLNFSPIRGADKILKVVE